MPREDRLIYLLTIAQKALANHVNAELAAKADNITMTQAGALFLLTQGQGSRMNELSRVLGADKSAMTGLVDRMEKAGLAQRKPDPSDRRAWLVAPTEKGRQTAQKARKVVNRVNDAIKQGYSEPEIAKLVELLQGIAAKFKG